MRRRICLVVLACVAVGFTSRSLAQPGLNVNVGVDFSAGLSFGLHGSIERVTTAVFLLSPAHVEIGVDQEPERTDHAFYNQA